MRKDGNRWWRKGYIFGIGHLLRSVKRGNSPTTAQYDECFGELLWTIKL